MRGVVLAGAGPERDVWPALAGRPRPLLPVANRAMIAHALDRFAQAGIEQVIIAADSRSIPPLRELVADGSGAGLTVTYVDQREALGPGHALRAIEPLAGDGPIVLTRADGIMRSDLRPLIDVLLDENVDGVLPIHHVPDPRSHAVVEATAAGRVRSVVEQPYSPAGTLAMAGVAVFSPRIFAAARRIRPSWRGRLELADAVTQMIGDGGHVVSRRTDRWWCCVSGPSELLEANRLLLDDLEPRAVGVNLADARVRGRAAIHHSAVLESTVINGPVIIGPGVRLRDAYIGPYTAIGPEVVIEGAEVENSVLLRGSVVRHLSVRLESSIVGEGAKIVREFALPRAMRVWVGDAVEVALA